MDCTESQYYHNGACHPCLQCWPGKELSEDCGYGSGRLAYCIPCSAKTYKEDWGFHNCKFCQSCKRLNRQQTSPCTSTTNAVCGVCLPGFYSKTRMDGRQDLECMPCGPSTRGEQCSRSRGVDVEKVWKTEGPNPNVAVANTVVVALVTLAIIFSMILLIYLRRTSLWRLLKGCLAFESRSQSDMESAASTLNKVTLNPIQEGEDSGPCDSFPAVSPLTRPPSSMVEFAPPGFISFNPHHQPQDYYQMLEAPVQNSTISDCSSGFVSQTSWEPPSDPVAMVPPVALEDYGEAVVLQQTCGGYCASEHQANYQHVPVECTELDIHQAVAACSTLNLYRQIKPRCPTSPRITASSDILDGSPGSRLFEQSRGPSACLEERADSCWRSPQRQACCKRLGGSDGTAETLNLLKRCSTVMQGVGFREVTPDPGGIPGSETGPVIPRSAEFSVGAGCTP